MAENQRERAGGPMAIARDAECAAGTHSRIGSDRDPGTPDGEQKLLFHERAFWLYLTGHRLGDMRRLMRSTAEVPTRSTRSALPSTVLPYGSTATSTFRRTRPTTRTSTDA